MSRIISDDDFEEVMNLVAVQRDGLNDQTYLRLYAALLDSPRHVECSTQRLYRVETESDGYRNISVVSAIDIGTAITTYMTYCDTLRGGERIMSVIDYTPADSTPTVITSVTSYT